MYATYEYYVTEYGGSLDEERVNRCSRIADRLLNKFTSNRLVNSFPTDKTAIDNVYQCECALIDYEAYVEDAKKAQAEGKVIKSVSSGSESVTYDTNVYAEAVKSEANHVQGALNICRTWIGGVPDANGINLLYAGL